jgi:hypothetical protein
LWHQQLRLSTGNRASANLCRWNHLGVLRRFSQSEAFRCVEIDEPQRRRRAKYRLSMILRRFRAFANRAGPCTEPSVCEIAAPNY